MCELKQSDENLITTPTSLTKSKHQSTSDLQLTSQIETYAGVTLPDVANKPSEFKSYAPNSALYNLQRNLTLPENKSALATLADEYFQPKSFERNGTFYKALGIGYFKDALTKTVGKLLDSIRNDKSLGTSYHLGGHTLKDLKMMEWFTRLNESIHLAMIVVHNIPFGLAEVYQNGMPSYFTAGFLMINAYCIMLQRFNRERLCKIIDRAEKRANRLTPKF